MGKFKELAISFDESHESIEYGSDKYFFVFDLWNKCREAGSETVKRDLKRFFNDIFPTLNNDEYIWCMASSPEGVSCNFSYKDKEQALRALSILSDEDINLYFSPSIFTGWRTDNNVSRINTIYIDIDDVDGTDFSEMDKEDIKEWLINTYSLNDSILPNWIVASGHGLHLYWIVREIDLKTDEGTELRKRYTDYLITHFKADISCRNKSRILRFPTSRNVKNKNNIRKTRLFHLNKAKSRDIKRLDFFKCSDEDIETYTAENIRKRSEKRKATMIKNGTWKERKEIPKETAKRPELIPKGSSGTRKKKTAKGYIPNEDGGAGVSRKRSGTLIRTVITSPMSPKSRYLRIIRDLQNYTIRRGTVTKGYRSIFCHILGVYCKKAKYGIKEAEAIILDCIDENFEREALNIVKSVYESKTEYTYTNERIAELLNFQDFDLESSYACYTETQRAERRKQTQSRYDNKRYKTSRQSKAELKQYRRNFIKEHIEMTVKELAKALGCSERTIRYIKSDMRKTYRAA
ncbi:MAG: hypothetical protein ACOYBV_08905 [Candidatus Avilachnospira sp.]|jgi:hypothetical protein